MKVIVKLQKQQKRCHKKFLVAAILKIYELEQFNLEVYKIIFFQFILSQEEMVHLNFFFSIELLVKC